jgi:predicted ATPase
MQKIQITNFMAIQSAEIEIKKTVLLIGEQASGKSTVAKLVYFFKTLKDDYLDVISENLEALVSGENIQLKLWDAIDKKFYKFFGSIQQFPEFHIKYWYSENKCLDLCQGSNGGGRKVLKIDFLDRPFYESATEDVLPLVKHIQKVSPARDKTGFRDTSRAYRVALKEISNYIEDLFEEDRHPFFIPAGRSIAVTYPDSFRNYFTGTLMSDLARIKEENYLTTFFAQDTYLMLQFLQRVEILKETFKGLTFETILQEIPDERKRAVEQYAKIASDKIEQILKGKYKFDRNFGEQILFNDKAYVHLSNSSSGQQEVIRILQDIFLILINNENVFRVIEEPEAHLFPTAQKRLLEVMALMLNATNSQILLTTHSPYILSVITNLLFASALTEKDANSSDPIPVYFRLKSAETAVYSLSNGESHSIVDQKTGLIDQNVLDTISEELAGEFDWISSKLIQAER